MKNNAWRSGVVCGVVIALTAPMAVMSQTTVFSDTLGSGSTVQSASPAYPTANSTAYEYFQQGANPTTPTIVSGDLHLAGRTTTSSISEAQALFTTTPVTLATIGDYVEFTMVFVDTTNIMVGGTTSSLNVGLFNSGQVLPNKGARLDTGTLSGGSQNWNGYVGRIFGSGVADIYTRAPQTPNGTSSQNQDLLFDGQSGSAGYNNPAAVSVGNSTTTFTSGLTKGSTYTLDFWITLSAASTLTISNALYSGSSVNPANILFSQIATASGATYLTNSFDAFAFGWRYNSTSGPNCIDVSSITVTVPEPSTVALLSGGALLAVIFRRRQLRN